MNQNGSAQKIFKITYFKFLITSGEIAGVNFAPGVVDFLLRLRMTFGAGVDNGVGKEWADEAEGFALLLLRFLIISGESGKRGAGVGKRS